MRKRLSVTALLLGAIGAAALFGLRGWQGGPVPPSARAADAEPAAEAGIRQAAQAYLDAHNRGDVDALLALWTADADYVDGTGQVHKGKQALGDLFRKGLADAAGLKLTGRILAIRFLRPDVAIEDGTLELVGPDGPATPSRYTAVWVKQGDRWLIASARDLAAEPDPAGSVHQRLRELEWMVGDWAHADAGDKLTLRCRWAPGKAFLIQEFTIAHGGSEPVTVTQWVGWNPLAGQLHSWFFDSRGGHGQGTWTRTGNTWKITGEGITPTGQIGSSVHTIKFLSDDAFLWLATDRRLDDRPLPDSESRLVRQVPK